MRLFKINHSIASLICVVMLFVAYSSHAQVSNQAIVTVPAGITDPIPDNNEATDEDPVQPTLTLVKAVINARGGTAIATDWTLVAQGPVTISGVTGSATVTNASVEPGSYALSETGGRAVYDASPWTCSIDGGAAVAGASVTLSYGQRAVCSITNSDREAPAIALIKQAIRPLTDTNGDGVAGSLGDVISYIFRVTNTGDQPLANVTVTDPKVTVVGGPLANLAVGATDSTTFTASYTITAADLAAGEVVNQATATGTSPVGTVVNDLSDDTSNTEDEPTVTPVPEGPRISLIKQATQPLTDTNGDGVAGGLGDIIFYTFRVTNTGDRVLTNVIVTDPKVTVVGGPLASLAVGASDSTTFTASYTITAADVVARQVVNQATATGTSPTGTNVSDLSDSSSDTQDDPTITPLVEAPAIALIKQAKQPPVDTNGDGVAGGLGDVISYTFRVTNTGDQPLANVTVTDPKVTVVGGPLANLAVGASDSATFTASYTITADDVTAGQVVNQATTAGTSPAGTTVTDLSDSASNTEDRPTVTPVLETPSQTLTKTVTGLDDRDGSGSVTAGDILTYTVTMTNTGPSATLNVTVSDNKASPGSITCASVAPQGTCILIGVYTVTLADARAGEVINTAVVISPVCPAGSMAAACTVTVTTPVEARRPIIQITKAASPHDVKIGDFTRYTILIINTGDADLIDSELIDTPPAGFTYVADSAVIADDDNAGLVTATYPIRIDHIDVAAGKQATITYLLRVGAGVRPGIHRNSAYVQDDTGPVSNVATAEVQLVADPMVDDSFILGTVWDDRDGDKWQDSATLSGLRIRGGFNPGAYIAGSTTIDRGAGPAAAPDASAPLLHGLALGVLAGRQSDADPVDNHRITVSQKLTTPTFTDDFVLTSNQGLTVRMDAAGSVRFERGGEAARGLTSAEVALERRVAQVEGGYRVDYVITNRGVDERGIPGVRVASVEGLLMETDQFGRYHLAGMNGGQWERGRNFVLKVDPATLPAGSRFTTSNPLVRRITPGIPVRFDFGVVLPSGIISGGSQTTEVELGEVIFAPGGAAIQPQYAAVIDRIADQVRQHGRGEIVIVANGETAPLAYDRARSVQAALGERLSPEQAAQTVVTLRTEVTNPGSTIMSLGPQMIMGTVLFDTDVAAIQPRFLPLIGKVAADIDRMGGGVVTVVGHADRRGSDAYNQRLGLARARAVHDAILPLLSPDTRARLRVETSDALTGADGNEARK